VKFFVDVKIELNLVPFWWGFSHTIADDDGGDKGGIYVTDVTGVIYKVDVAKAYWKLIDIENERKGYRKRCHWLIVMATYY
jgi:hypothetical protein